MKKLMSVMLGLTFVLGTASLFAQDTTKDTTKTTAEKKHKKPKKEKKTTTSEQK